MTNKIQVSNGHSNINLDSKNPYVLVQDSLLDNHIMIPQDLMNKAIKLENMNCLIRFICLCDIFLAFSYFLYGWLIGAFFLIISINGYLSTIYYKKSLMLCYVIYQYFQTIGRLFNLIFFIAEPTVITYSSTNSTINTTINKSSNLTNVMIIDIALLSILFLSQCIIAYYITKYYNLLPTEEEKRRISISIA